LMMPPLHGERMRTYCHLIGEITHSVLAEIPLGSEFRARDVMQKISMRVILKAVFGLAEGDRYRQLEALLRDRIEMTGNPLRAMTLFFPILQRNYGPWSPGARHQKLAAEVDQLIFAEISERRASGNFDQADMLSLLLSAQDQQGNGLSNQELRDELMTLLVAGHETTATALAWALYWLHRDPAMKHRLVEEIAEAKDAFALTRLPYLTAVCQETLRIYPVAVLTFPRRVEQPVEVLGHTLQPGQMVVGSIYLIHHRPDLYPDSRRFRPERFLEWQYGPHEFLPFGGGSRRCIGASLALFEMQLVLGTILANYDLRLLETRPVKPQRRGVTLSPAGGIRLRLDQRRLAAEPALSLGH
ncbi:cytochrome P450, partial [filamentous cyanobacterium CCP5]